MATWSAPSEGSVFGVVECNAEPLMKFLSQKNDDTLKISVTTAVIKALGLALREAPSLNCTILSDKFIPRKSLDISCLVAVDDGKDLANAKIENADKLSLQAIQRVIKQKAEKLRKHQDKDYESTKVVFKLLPVPLLRIVVAVVGWLSGCLGIEIGAIGVHPFPFGSCMVTSVGMLGVEQAFVPFTPFAHVPLLVMIGEVTRKPVVVVDERKEESESSPGAAKEPKYKVEIQQRITLTATIDHRFADGAEVAKCAKKLKFYIENPEHLNH